MPQPRGCRPRQPPPCASYCLWSHTAAAADSCAFFHLLILRSLRCRSLLATITTDAPLLLRLPLLPLLTLHCRWLLPSACLLLLALLMLALLMLPPDLACLCHHVGCQEGVGGKGLSQLALGEGVRDGACAEGCRV